MLENVRISGKLLTLGGVIAAGAVAIVSSAYLQGRDAEAGIVRMAGEDLELLVDLNELYAQGLQTGQATRNVLLDPNDKKAAANYQDAHEAFLAAMDRAAAVARQLWRDVFRGDVRISVHFGDRDRSVIHAYYESDFRHGRCPPGLAKKRNGCMPPGQAKKWRKGYPLPPSVVYYELPPDLIYRMPPPPPRHRYVRVGSDILLLSIGSGIVVDAMIDIGR